MKLFTFLRGEAFARGIHPPQHKGTAATPIARLPFAPRLSSRCRRTSAVPPARS